MLLATDDGPVREHCDRAMPVTNDPYDRFSHAPELFQIPLADTWPLQSPTDEPRSS